MSLNTPPSRVSTLSSANRFLPSLAQGLLSGDFWPDIAPDGRWFMLASARIFLPNRRACRVLKDMLLERAGGAVLLPRIQALGDLGHDDDAGDARLDHDLLQDPLPQSIDSRERIHALVRLIAKWQAQRHPHENTSLGADSFALAEALSQSLGIADTFQIDWRKLDTIDAGALSDNWQIVRDFLELVTDAWPNYLKETGLVSPETRRRLSMERLARQWHKNPPQTPVIIAGSLGVQPASRRLMQALVRLPRGFLVVADFDPEADNLQPISDNPADLTFFQHPQAALQTLIKSLGVTFGHIDRLGPPPDAIMQARDGLLREVMRSANETSEWATIDERFPEKTLETALEGLTLIQAPTPHHESVAIAIALRQVLETPEKTAILVTPDRALAERVAGELKRFDIDIDDSAGQNLQRFPLTRLCLDCAELAFQAFDPNRLLTLLDHPMVSLNMPIAEKHLGREALELALFRATPAVHDWQHLQTAYQARRAASALDLPPENLDPLVKSLSSDMWQAGQSVLDSLLERYEPLLNKAQPLSSLGELANEHRQLFLSLLDNQAVERGGYAAVLAGLEQHIISLKSEFVHDLTLAPRHYPALLSTLFSSQRVRGPSRGRAEPRLTILGPLEARLQSADVMVLAGLVEGQWPAIGAPDPWLSRSMRAHLGFEPLEARIGLAAHDWQSFMRAPEVILSCAEMIDGKPVIPSRWLQRLKTVAQPEGSAAMITRGQTLLQWGRLIDHPAIIAPCSQPRPCLKAEARPKRISFTDIERLLVNPYNFYARKILGLRALPRVGRPLGSLELGLIIHDGLERFIRQNEAANSHPENSDAASMLTTCLHEAMQSFQPNKFTETIWGERFNRLAKWFVAWDAPNRRTYPLNLTELSGEMSVELASKRRVTLTGRIDRIAISNTGAFQLYDYKTGTLPEKSDIREGYALQLHLGAVLALNGAYKASLNENRSRLANTLMTKHLKPDDLIYVQVTGQKVPVSACRLKSLYESGPESMSLIEASQHILTRVIKLLSHYEQEDSPYPAIQSLGAASRYDDYAHLARFSEWHAEAGFGGDNV